MIQRIFLSVLLVIAFHLTGCGSGNGDSNTNNNDSDLDGVVDTADCAPNDNTKWAMHTYESIDLDADGFRANAKGEVCSGNFLPGSYYSSTIPDEYADCNDADKKTWHTKTVYNDKDGDGIGFGEPVLACVGVSAGIIFHLLIMTVMMPTKKYGKQKLSTMTMMVTA